MVLNSPQLNTRLILKKARISYTVASSWGEGVLFISFWLLSAPLPKLFGGKKNQVKQIGVQNFWTEFDFDPLCKTEGEATVEF